MKPSNSEFISRKQSKFVHVVKGFLVLGGLEHWLLILVQFVVLTSMNLMNTRVYTVFIRAVALKALLEDHRK